MVENDALLFFLRPEKDRAGNFFFVQAEKDTAVIKNGILQKKEKKRGYEEEKKAENSEIR